jgi:hypothetical protein
MPTRTPAIDLRGPAGPLDAVWHADRGEGAAGFAAVAAHPHPLYGGTKENPVVLAVADALTRAGGATLRFDFRGVGRSAGTHDRGRGEVDDLRAAARLAAASAPRLPLLIAGYSFGAAMALHLLAGSAGDGAQPAAILALAPPIGHYDFSFLARNRTPLVLLCGDADALTPRAEVGRLCTAWGGVVAVLWLAGAGHDLGVRDRPAALHARLDDAVRRLVDSLRPRMASTPHPGART